MLDISIQSRQVKGSMKKHFLFLVLVAGFLFQSCASVINFTDPNGPEYKGAYAHAALINNRDVKVVTYNIAWAKKAELAKTELQNTPTLQHADIILLQEMDAKSVDSMAKKLGYNYVYFPGCIHNLTDNDIGNAILSPWTLTDEKKLIFPHKQSWNDRIRLAAVATVLIDGRRIRVYNVHTATVMMSEDKQFDQLESVLDDVPKDYDHIIIGGDFNTGRPGSVERSQQLFADAGFYRASQNAGYTSRILGIVPITLDHIYSRGMQVLQSGVVRSARASDHLPLWAVFRFNQPAKRLAAAQAAR